jgi:transcription elongation factor Elf1
MNKNGRNLAVFGTGVAALIAFVVILLQDAQSIGPISGTTVLVILGLLAFVLLSVGTNLFLVARKVALGEAVGRRDYRHTVPVFALLVVVVIAGLVARELFVPDTYGRYGSYRAEAVAEARDKPQSYVGVQTCATCHEEIARLRSKDVHAKVQCETCHGTGAAHATNPETAMVVPDGRTACLTCHQKLDARLASFPQIDVAAHFAFLGVVDPNLACTECHSPHEPLFLDRDLHEARMHPIVHRCRDCHIGRTDESLEQPAGHPQIFTCKYCHSKVVEDFQDRAHADIGCTTCHLFLKENSFSGRIVLDADPRFCLLCHREAAFKGDSAPPGITWPEHLDDVAEDDADRAKRCIDCHREMIHAPKGGDHE